MSRLILGRKRDKRVWKPTEDWEWWASAVASAQQPFSKL
jgi:hypothetical protein